MSTNFVFVVHVVAAIWSVIIKYVIFTPSKGWQPVVDEYLLFLGPKLKNSLFILYSPKFLGGDVK